jgi:hypothetical protein
MNLFGFEITRAKDKQENPNETENKSFALPQSDDGAVTVQSGGGYYGTYVDLDGVVRNEIELITRYREMAMQPELEIAIDEIVNEAIVNDDAGHAVDINLDDLKQPENVKRKIRDEFDIVLRLLNFGNMGHEVFRRWYVDGRIFYHIMIDPEAVADGISEIRYIDPRRIRKIREIQKQKDPRTGVEVVVKTNEYFLYNERGMIGAHSNLGARIAVDAVVNVNSGLMDSRRAMVLSYLHKAIKPLNNLRMMEDAAVIYRLSRAPERRIFYIDVGNMPTIKADQYLKDIMTKYRNKLVYDSSTGEIKDDRKHLSMLEDFWLPRREGGKGTEISTLPGGQNLGELEDVKYFERKLYKALGVPISRIDPQPSGGILGRTTEITRDELKFTKFIQRMRNKFAQIFDDLLRIQLVAKGICTEEEWTDFKEEIWYDFRKDNNFNELKEAELLMNRLQILTIVDPYVGRYYSKEWVRRNVLQQDDDEMKEIDKQIEKEAPTMPPVDPTTGLPMDPMAAQQGMMPGQPPMPGQPALPPPNASQTAAPTTPMPLPKPPQSKFTIQKEDIEFV